MHVYVLLMTAITIGLIIVIITTFMNMVRLEEKQPCTLYVYVKQYKITTVFFTRAANAFTTQAKMCNIIWHVRLMSGDGTNGCIVLYATHQNGLYYGTIGL